MRAKRKTGRVNYGERAFHQDATAAMRGDIIRGLIEAITNSDDAYGANKGKILIELERKRPPWRVVVRDRATGMSPEKMEKAILSLGERTSGFEEGQQVRGNLGRGAKDLAGFGQVEFESVCNGQYSRLLLEPTGAYDFKYGMRDTDNVRERLSIPRGNGTVVTVHVSGNVACPQFGSIRDKLSKHYQLRDILADPQREVLLEDKNKGVRVTLHYSYPDFPVVYSGPLAIEGYDDAGASVTILRSTERFDEAPSDPYRSGGLLIKGRRAVYEATLFGLESKPHAGWFLGEVNCPYIDFLVQEYDNRLAERQVPDGMNPMPIIKRSRDGLEHNHPFYKSLAQAVEAPLGELVATEEKSAREQGSRESARLRRSLDALGRDLARLIDEDFREIDEEGMPGVGGGDDQVPDMKLVPEQVVLFMGEDKTMTVQARTDLGLGEVALELDPGGVVEVLNEGNVQLGPHPRRKDVLTGQIKVRPLLEERETLLTATCNGHSALALLEVRPERIVEVVEIEPPTSLQFERATYRVAWGKRRKIRILAPVDLVADMSVDVRFASSDEGVVVLGGNAQLRLDDELECYVGDAEIEARTVGARAKLRAWLGSVEASCNVIVARDVIGPDLRFILVDEEQGNRRAEIVSEDGRLLMRIMARHPALQRYLGNAPEFPGQDRSASRAVMAEIIATEAARLVLEKKYPFRGVGEEIDAPMLYDQQFKYLRKYLPRCHKALVPETSLD